MDDEFREITYDENMVIQKFLALVEVYEREVKYKAGDVSFLHNFIIKSTFLL